MKNPYEDYEDNEENRKKLNLLTTPLSAYSIPRWLIYLLGVVGLIYILNPTAGIIELLPDNLPFIGNLDEGVAFLLMWAAVLEFFEGGKYREEENDNNPPA